MKKHADIQNISANLKYSTEEKWMKICELKQKGTFNEKY